MITAGHTTTDMKGFVCGKNEERVKAGMLGKARLGEGRYIRYHDPKSGIAKVVLYGSLA